MTTYVVTFGANEYKVDIFNGQYRVNGERIDMKLRRLNEQGLYLLQQGNRLREVLMNRRDDNQVAMVMDRKHLTVQVERDGAQGEKKEISKGTLSAPMPGTIIEVRATENQHVEQGQVIAVMESMKMQMEMRSPTEGVVQKILVKPGDKVEKGTVLARVEG